MVPFHLCPLFVNPTKLNIYTQHLGWFLEFYDLVAPKVIVEQVPTCDSAYSWRLYNDALLGEQATSAMT